MDLAETKKLVAKLRESIEAEILRLGPPSDSDLALYSEAYQKVFKKTTTKTPLGDDWAENLIREITRIREKREKSNPH